MPILRIYNKRQTMESSPPTAATAAAGQDKEPALLSTNQPAAIAAAAPYRAKLPYFDSLSWFQCSACRKWRIADFEMAHSQGQQWRCQDAFWSDEFQAWSNKCQFQQDKPVTCINPHPLARNHLEVMHKPTTRPASSADDAAKRARALAAFPNKPQATAATAGKYAPQQGNFQQANRSQPQGPAFPAPLPNKNSTSTTAFNEFWFLQFVTGVNKRLTNEGLSVPLRSCTDIILNENSSPMLCFNAFEEIKRWLRGNQALEHELREIMRTHPHSSHWQ